METIGFIGIGRIGLAICQQLLERGGEVIGYRRSSLSAFEQLGGTSARSPADVGDRTSIIFSCLPNADALEDVVYGSCGLLASARPGQVIVELGSHALSVKRRYVDVFAERGVTFLDGEVSGTPGMVANRKAYIYLAGDRLGADRVEPVVRQFTDLYLYLGDFGNATNVKLINNLLVALHIAGTAQAMAIGLRLGLPSDQLIDAIARGSGGSTQFAIRAPWMAEGAFTPQQGSAQALLQYLLTVKQSASTEDVATDLVDGLIEIYQRAAPHVGDRDVAALFEYFNSSRQNEGERR